MTDLERFEQILDEWLEQNGDDCLREKLSEKPRTISGRRLRSRRNGSKKPYFEALSAQK